MKRLTLLLTVMAVLCLLIGSAIAGEILDAVKAKGFVQCGVGDVNGFAKADEQGVIKGIDADTGRAIAAAVFGDASKIKFTTLSAQQRFPAVQSGEVDVLCRTATHTLHRDTALGLDFAHVTYYDGQGFLITKKMGVKSALELEGATVCVLPGTTTELNVADYFRAKGMKWKPVVIEGDAEINKAFMAGRCDVMTGDASNLFGIRAATSNPDDYMILPEIISKEPLAPAVRQGDSQWLDIVNWTVAAMITAEEFGITSKNVDKFLKSDNPGIMRFLGTNPGMGKDLGLDEKWAYNIIKQVGNYGEIFERNVGVKTKLGIARGLNALWTNGGLMYSPPFK